ncbi:unnamed protein product [Adineta steineri]|uniref:NAD(P)(+)--arginine ADP-ribosyltransferase n=1 Tax=Adineta steineri TaxID=433720 RepID=A0A814CAU4_9BILA|nr:unnamed protein product [Adineta steineri]CAF0937743.1 unnamed protein product [Adineta steineri]CAF3818901.1 unnamed protein product [Adineta steineri]CAF3832624.1 unnamed protein product [Adineta steineri]
MSESGSNQKVSSSLNSFMKNNNITTISSDVIQPEWQMVKNYSLLWLDEDMNETSKDYENILAQIRNITDDINVFKQQDACIDFLTDAQENIKFFLVVKYNMAQQIMPLINDIPQLYGVYIFNDIKIPHEEWTKNWNKIRNIYTHIDDLYKALQLDIKKFNQDTIAMSFLTADEIASKDDSNQLDPAFMYTQIFKEILLDMKHDEQAIKHFIDYCRRNDCISPTNINRFEKEYNAQLAIWWYTFPSDIFTILNDALRCMEGNMIINMGFFINDLHQQIQQLYQQQINTYGGKSFVVYRGQGFMKSDFQKLQKTKGGLMSFNNFLSTSYYEDVSLDYARSASTAPNKVGILFIMSIDPNVKSAPFASIKELSHFNEEDEILFSMHTVFRVGEIKEMDNETQVYQVELQLTSDDDQQLRLLTDRMREEAGGSTGWRRLGKLLLKIGQFNKAEEVYNTLLEQTSDEDEKAICYHQLGWVKGDQGDYEKAIWYYEQALKIQQKILPSNHSDLANSYNNIGSVYEGMGNYLKTIYYYEKALEIEEKTLSSTHPDLAASYNNIGSVKNKMGKYSEAISFYEKAHEIKQKTFLPNHPDLATSYDNIAGVYGNMEEYSKALSLHKKALEIYQKSLPSNHHDLATSYSNIGGVYYKMGDYSEACSNYEKALKIEEKTLSLDHPDLATTYNNIGLVNNDMGDYSKAISFYEKALEIEEKTPSPNLPHLATSYNNIAGVYAHMREYSKALSYYKKDLEICQTTLCSDHPDLATSYNNIAMVYCKMQDYSKALSHYESALHTFQHKLSSTHPVDLL